MIEMRIIPEEITQCSGGGVEGITTCVVSNYEFDQQGNVVGVANGELHSCRMMATSPDATITISVPEKGFAISVLFGDIVSLINQVGHTPLND